MTITTSAAARLRRATILALRALFLTGVTVAASGCGGASDSSTAPDNNTDPKGLYDLRTIDNTALPQEVYHGPWFDPENRRFYNQMVLLVTRGSVNVIKGERWAMSLDITRTLDGVASTTTLYADGSYELQGTDLVLKPTTPNLTEVTGTLDRGTISFSLEFNGSKRPKAFNFKK